MIPKSDELRTYIGTLKQVHSSPISDSSLNAIQGYEDSEDIDSNIASIKTDFGVDHTTKLHSILHEHNSALQTIVGASGTTTRFRHAHRFRRNYSSFSSLSNGFIRVGRAEGTA